MFKWTMFKYKEIKRQLNANKVTESERCVMFHPRLASLIFESNVKNNKGFSYLMIASNIFR